MKFTEVRKCPVKSADRPEYQEGDQVEVSCLMNCVLRPLNSYGHIVLPPQRDGKDTMSGFLLRISMVLQCDSDTCNMGPPS